MKQQACVPSRVWGVSPIESVGGNSELSVVPNILDNIKRCLCFGLWCPSPRFPVAFSAAQVVSGHLEVQWAKLLEESRTTLCQGTSGRVGWESQGTRMASWWRGLKDNLELFLKDFLVTICSPSSLTIPCPASMLTQPQTSHLVCLSGLLSTSQPHTSWLFPYSLAGRQQLKGSKSKTHIC